MTQCRGTTKKGERCRREANAASEFCASHQSEESTQGNPFDEMESRLSDTAKAVLGLAFGAVILLYAMTRE